MAPLSAGSSANTDFWFGDKIASPNLPIVGASSWQTGADS